MSGKDSAEQERQDRLIKERIHDPYMTRENPPEPTLCPECGVAFMNGRWQWPEETPAAAREELCPACQRIRDGVPAGILTLKGPFFQAHREEILNLLHNKERAEKAQHPMKRLMAIDEEEDGDGVVVTFTDRHLPRGVGTAIESAYEGDLDIHYADEAGIVRAFWER